MSNILTRSGYLIWVHCRALLLRQIPGHLPSLSLPRFDDLRPESNALQR